MSAIPNWTSVCEYHTFRAESLSEALRNAADFIELKEIMEPSGFEVREPDAHGDDLWSVSFMGDYRGNANFAKLGIK